MVHHQELERVPFTGGRKLRTLRTLNRTISDRGQSSRTFFRGNSCKVLFAQWAKFFPRNSLQSYICTEVRIFFRRILGKVLFAQRCELFLRDFYGKFYFGILKSENTQRCELFFRIFCRKFYFELFSGIFWRKF